MAHPTMAPHEPETSHEPHAPGAPEDLAAILEAEGRRTLSRRTRLIGMGVAALLVVGAAAAFMGRGGGDAVRYQTANAERGDLTVTVTATGTVQPVTEVQVGIEVSGTVAEVLADYNDRVKVGQVLLRLDTAKLKAQALQSAAALKAAEAQLLQAQATVKESQANLSRLEDVRKLSGGKVPSQQDIDTAEAALERAQAAQGSAEASIAEAKAGLSVDDTNLAKAVVRSPVDGIVLSRSVEPGQTVAASLQAPNLFLLAESLSQMEVDVAVDEADVGQVKEGQPATFTVEAYPDRQYPAVISQVRYFPTTLQGVVTYQAVLSVNNADLTLRPGMTATAEITVAKRQGALLVPNAALRFAPKNQGAQRDDRSFVTRVLMPFRRPPRERREAPGKDDLPQKVWVMKDGAPAAVRIKTGATDGRMTEVVAGDLAPGTPLLVDVLPTGKTGS
jgi:HlyD family secretion protein